MKQNIGFADRTIRSFIALLIVVLFLTKVITGTLGLILLAIAGIFLLTAVFGFCPLYYLFGMNSCPQVKR